MYNTILFDLDGTLTDSKEGITKSVQYALKDFGIEVDNLDQLQPFLGPPLQVSFKEFYGFNNEDTNIAIAKYRERFATIGAFENSVYEGVEELLQDLIGEGKELAIATSKPEVYTLKILERFNLKKYFKVIVGSELDGSRSSKGLVIKEVFKRLKLDNIDNVVMVGDREHDVIGAKECNIPVIGVKYGYGRDGELEQANADYIVDNIEELRNILLMEGKKL